MEAMRPSPPMIARAEQVTSGRSRPSTSNRRGRRGSEAVARAIAHSVALRMSWTSMREGGAKATATSAVAQMMSNSASRSGAVSFLESSSPSGTRSGSRITAAATTGPAHGPRPTSSAPAMGASPAASASRS